LRGLLAARGRSTQDQSALSGWPPRAADATRPSQPRVSVVVPALNEAKNIGHVLALIPADTFEVILIDGWSTDATIERARDAYPGLRVIRQTRYGKGNALACGFAASRGDIIVMLDADGSADPAEISRFVDALVAGADFAKGTRFAAGGRSEDITPIRRSGNWCLNRLVNVLYRTRSTDLCYGYMAFWADCLPVLAVAEDGFLVSGDLEADVTGTDPRRARSEIMRWGDGFEIETLITVRAAAGGLRTAEVGSFEGRRMYGTSNLNAISDGWRVLRTIAAEKNALRRSGGVVEAPAAVGLSFAAPDPRSALVEVSDGDFVGGLGDVETVLDITDAPAALEVAISSSVEGTGG
jgi:hypothetical protein